MIAIASDHAGFDLKEKIKEYLKETGKDIKDFGTNSVESCDYPDYAHPAARSVIEGECEKGIAICGSGEGMAMTLNKYAEIRAALCWLPELAELSRQHNDANFLVLPARFVTPQEALEITKAFFEARFEGGRHERRVKKIPPHISVEGEIL